jgi:hypothetical protein
MTILNLTPHAITLRGPDGEDTVLEPAAPKGGEPRVGNAPGVGLADHPLAGIVAVHGPDEAGEVENLPDPQPGVFLVVSGMVGDAIQKRGIFRHDVLVPGTGPQDGAVRNDKGHIVAVTRIKALF